MIQRLRHFISAALLRTDDAVVERPLIHPDKSFTTFGAAIGFHGFLPSPRTSPPSSRCMNTAPHMAVWMEAASLPDTPDSTRGNRADWIARNNLVYYP